MNRNLPPLFSPPAIAGGENDHSSSEYANSGLSSTSSREETDRPKNPLITFLSNEDPLLSLFSTKTIRYFLFAIIILLMLFAFQKIRLVDDAFISFRYAKNLVEGVGLVFNPGERVEGYTNFLWVMLMAAGLKIGILPEHFAVILSGLIHVSCLLMSYFLALKLLKNYTLAVIMMLLTGSNWTIANFATSGLETPLQLLEFLTTACIVLHGMQNGWNRRLTLALALVLNIALLTRPDAIVLTAVALWYYFRSHEKIKAVDLAAILIPFLLILTPYLIWKAGYYGSITPNSFHAKVHGLTGVGYGLLYLYLFILSYLIFPYIFILLLNLKIVSKAEKGLKFIGGLIIAWISYVVLVGGDFMEFRFFIPVMPLISLYIIGQIRNIVPERSASYLLIFGLFLGTISNSLGFGTTIRGWGIQKTEVLSRPLTGEGENWIGIGRKLKEYYGGTDVRIALGSCGAIPYYSELMTIDMLGINDSTVPDIGNKLGVMAGHRIIAPLSYLIERRVNLVLWPNNFNIRRDEFDDWIKRANWNTLYRYYLDIDRPIEGRYVNDAQLLAIPFDENTVTVAWYLTPHPAVDRVARENGFIKVRIGRSGGR